MRLRIRVRGHEVSSTLYDLIPSMVSLAANLGWVEVLLCRLTVQSIIGVNEKKYIEYMHTPKAVRHELSPRIEHPAACSSVIQFD